jgi:hypothetical protein
MTENPNRPKTRQMGYSLWQSEDASYTLGHRLGADRPEPSDAGPAHAPAPVGRPSREEMDHIDFLMETLARKLEADAG